MSYSKAYTLGNNFWENEPSVASPINDTNLNKTGNAINTIDDRVISLEASKANQSDLLTAVRSVTLNTTTGVITITQMDGTVTTYDTVLEKVAVNFDFDDDPTSAHYENLVITLDDGTVKYVDMSSLITQYEFVDSQRIGFTVGNDGSVSADIKAGSITENELQPNYLADITAQAASAQASATSAAASADSASADATEAESWAVGNTGTRQGENTDNAKYYAEQARQIIQGNVASFNGRTGAVVSTQGDYDATQVMYSQSQTVKQAIDTKANSADLSTVATTGDYDDLLNKPEHLGHSIKDATTTYTDRASLKFTGNVEITDDSTNDTTEVEIKGAPEYYYDTMAEAEADIDNIEEGATVYVKEGGSSDIISQLAAKQPKTLSQSIAGETTVEGALGEMQPKTLSQSVAGQSTVEGALDKVDSKLKLLSLVRGILESYQGRYLLYFHETESQESAEESYFRVDFNTNTKQMTCTKKTDGANVVVGTIDLNRRVRYGQFQIPSVTANTIYTLTKTSGNYNGDFPSNPEKAIFQALSFYNDIDWDLKIQCDSKKVNVKSGVANPQGIRIKWIEYIED